MVVNGGWDGLGWKINPLDLDGEIRRQALQGGRKLGGRFNRHRTGEQPHQQHNRDQGGKVVFTGTIEVAKDGQSRVVKTTLSDAHGSKYTDKAYYDKQ